MKKEEQEKKNDSPPVGGRGNTPGKGRKEKEVRPAPGNQLHCIG